jgi:transposase
VIVIGVDAHKENHTVVAVEQGTGRLIAELSAEAREPGFVRLLGFADRHGDGARVWAVEDCRHVSGGLERFLLRAGETMVRVPPKMMAGERRAARTFGKSDAIDALAVARAYLREPGLPVARLDGPEREIALLVDYRADLVAESTRLQTRVRWLLHDLDPTLAPACRGLRNEGVLVALARRLARREQSVQVRVCRDRVRRLRELTRQIKQLERELAPLVARHGAPLLDIPGCGVVTAARLLGEIGQIDRFRTDAQLAIYAGAAPLDASSGKQRRHRLNRTGNRQLNSALHVIALTQARIHPGAREYLARRRTEGKTAAEAIRALKRHLARMIFRIFKAIARTAAAAGSPTPNQTPTLTQSLT